jgi:hypothetical protein
MSQLTIRKTYADGDTPTQSDFDNICDSIEDFLNVTKLTTDNIASLGITTEGVFEDESITGAKFQSSAITTAKVLDASVPGEVFADNSVPTAYRSTALNEAYSTGGDFTVTNGNNTVWGNTVSLTTSGLPVLLMLVPASSSTSYIHSTDNKAIIYLIDENGTALITSRFGYFYDLMGTLKAPPSSIATIYQPTAGAHTYSIRFDNNSTNPGSVGFVNCKLYAVEVF